MRTIEVTRFGGPEVLQLHERPDPVPGAGHVLLDVVAIPLDTALRSGAARQWFPAEPPFVPGNGVAGTVRAVGAGVEDSWIGLDVVAGLDSEAVRTVARARCRQLSWRGRD